MQTGYSPEKNSRTAECAALLLAALALSYVEILFPLQLILPLPGAKLGLANLAVLIAADRLGFPCAAAVSLSRVLLSAVLFGSLPSLFFSLSGAVFSLAILFLLRPLHGKFFSWVGISVLCAAAHNTAQLLCAVLWMHDGALFSYLPILLVLAVFSGGLVGFVSNLLCPLLPSPIQRNRL